MPEHVLRDDGVEDLADGDVLDEGVEADVAVLPEELVRVPRPLDERDDELVEVRLEVAAETRHDLRETDDGGATDLCVF